ncbi:MAG TPA: tRNA lysidine(34) synthetase TilS [Candidatus Dormibacteraeota bacterium]|nr:tRNA lysidine(34) synthetase TilS [Candidatus Dormibacteraeota bacterium]
MPDAVTGEIHSTDLIAVGERVLVAFSGGHDSTALLLALREEGHDLVAAHYDHALQEGSALVATHVRRVCAALGVPLVIERRGAPLGKGSVQAAARALRYEFLERAAAEAGAHKVALAHIADDRVEGAAMHLLRGCGLAGLRGMPARRGRFVRPLLNVWRSEVIAYLEARGVSALEDPANSNLSYARVRMRRQILPALERDRPGIVRRLHAAAQTAAAMQDAITARAAGTSLRAAVAAMSPPVAAERMRTLYAEAGGRLPALTRGQLESMVRLAAGVRGGTGIDLPGGMRFRVVGSRMEVVARVPPLMESVLNIRPCSGCDEAGAAHLKLGALTLGHRRPGLRMRPAGGAGSRKLQDILVDARVPREDRDALPLVFAGDRLAWVPGVAVDRELQAEPGETSLHVTVTRILSVRNSQMSVLESPDSPPGDPS